MKFFKNNKALTLIELITSVTISSMLFFMIFIFITDSVEELVNNQVKVDSIDEAFTFKDAMGRFVRGGFKEAIVLTGSYDSSYTGSTNPNPNTVLYLKKHDLSEGLLVGVIDINTKMIQKNYTYGNNYLGYKYVSSGAMVSLDADYDLVYDQVFANDKIFQGLRMKDFVADTYNSGDIIDISFSVINLYDDSLFDQDFEEFFVDELVIDEYNLVY